MQQVLPFPGPMPSADPTIREVVGLYLTLEAKIQTRRAKKPWEERERILRAFVGAYGDARVSQCTKAILKIWIEGNQNLKSIWTRSRWCRTVQRVFNWAADEMELTTRNPFKGVRYGNGKRGRPLTEDEIAAILNVAGPVFTPVIRFILLTGARPDEMSRARWDNLTLDPATNEAWITLLEHKTCDYENAKPRVIALGTQAVELLATIRRSYGCFPGFEPEWIFVNARKKPWTKNSLGLRVRRLRAKAGLPADAKLYGLRHAFATTAVINNVALKDLAELLGHTSTKMSEYYVHLANQQHRLSRIADQAAGPAAPKVPPSPSLFPES